MVLNRDILYLEEMSLNSQARGIETQQGISTLIPIELIVCLFFQNSATSNSNTNIDTSFY